MGRNCLVSFEGRHCAAPFMHPDKNVQARDAPGTLQIIDSGQVLQEYPSGTRAWLLIDQASYDPAIVSIHEPAIAGAMDVRVEPPAPLVRVDGRGVVADRSREAARTSMSGYEAVLKGQRSICTATSLDSHSDWTGLMGTLGWVSIAQVDTRPESPFTIHSMERPANRVWPTRSSQGPRP